MVNTCRDKKKKKKLYLRLTKNPFPRDDTGVLESMQERNHQEGQQGSTQEVSTGGRESMLICFFAHRRGPTGVSFSLSLFLSPLFQGMGSGVQEGTEQRIEHEDKEVGRG